MPNSPPVEHECDLFLLSSHHPYVADRILPEFARQGCRNIHGWGLGYYAGDQARILRRAERAVSDGRISGEFAVAVETIASPIILGHLRLTSSGQTRRENNHPFHLTFLGYDWLLIHNGTARNPEALVPAERRLLTDSDNDTPRVFEFLREQIVAYCDAGPRKSLIEACRAAFVQLLDKDAGKFNLILTNGQLTFVFVHWRPFFLLHRPKETGDVKLISTLALTEHEDWIEFRPSAGRKARMLVFSGPTLVLNGDIPA
jgi:glutamine amidotransferase